MAKIKISQLPAKAANLAATDLLEVSEVSGLTYVSKKITGAELVGNRVPYTGATSDVDLGEYELKAGQIELDQSPTGTAGVAVTRWNDSIGLTETTLKGGSVIIKNGVDLVARVVNNVTPNTTLTKAAYPVVKISGAQGQRLAVDYAQANNDNNSADTLGVVAETIATNQEGFIMTVGQLEGVNTSGSLQGETWLDGDVLYLSPTVPGAVTKVKPTGATGHIVVIGYVEHAHNVNGKIYVKIMNGWELDELHNVYIDNGTLANNQVLTYESATQLWKNKTPETGITVGTTSSTGTNGRVFFQAGGVVQQDANFTFDNTLKRLTLKAVNTGASDIPFAVQNSAGTANLVTVQGNGNVGIGIDSPLDRLHISQTVVGSNNILRMTSASINANGIRFLSADASIQGSFLATGSTFSYGTYLANQCNLIGGSGGIGLRASNTSNINFYGGNVDADFGVNYFRLFGSTGNVLIQNGGTYTDNGFRLDVNGTTRLNGNTSIGGSTPGARLDVRAQGALSTDIAFRVRNSADTDNLIESAGNGLVKFRTGTERIEINTSASDYKMSLYKFGTEMTKISTYASYFCYGGSGQYLGVGTNAPSHLLDIINSSNPILTRWGNEENSLGGSDITLKFTTRYTGGSSGGNPLAYLTIGGTGAGVNSNNKSYFKFLLSKANTLAERASITSQSNLLLQSPTEDTNDVGVIYIPNGTAPTTSIANGGKLYVEAGALRYRDVNGDITNAGGTVQAVASAATVTPVYTNKFVKITAQAAALTLANPTGTWAEGQDLMIRIKDDGLGARAITWDTNYRAIGVTLPTTTVLGKTTYVGVIYNSNDSIWDVIGVTTQA